MDASPSIYPNTQLRQERIGRNWRQQDLADQLGTTVVTIKRWERGSQQPSAYFRIKLCALFGKSSEELGLIPENPQPAAPTEAETSTSVEIVPLSHSSSTPSVWGVPYPRNPHFTGRDDLLERLAQELSFERRPNVTTPWGAMLSQPQAVKGLGGIGKTQIAVEYAYRAREQRYYAHFLWINAASEETILISFQALAEQLLSFTGRNEKDQRKLIIAIHRWLQACPEPWLLIVDNADELSLVQPYLPQQGRGSILLTTRASAVAWLTASSIEVEQMGLVEGTQFLLHRTQRLSALNEEEYNEACNVVIALDGFPLALDQAGAYIEETECSFGDYLQLYEHHRATLLARRGKQATNYPDSVATTWLLSFEKIEQAHPAAVELLQLCTFLSPDHIPEELLINGAAHWPAVLQQAVADQFSFNELLEALLAFSLVKRLTQGRLLSLHRLVQAVQMDRMDLPVQRAWAERVVSAVNTLFPLDPKQVNTWSLCLRYLEQVQACDRLIQHHCLQSPEAADLLNRAGIYLREHASFSIAEPLFQRALVIYEQQWGCEYLQVASPLNNLAILYRRQGRHEQAEPLFLRALHIREQALGPHHPEVAPLLNNLAILYRQQGRHEQAEPLFLRALHIWEHALGPHHLGVAPPLNNLAILYAEQGKYELAEPLLQRALHIGEQVLGPHHPEVAHPLNNLGNLYAEQGQYEQAEPLFQQVLHIWEHALGSEHPLVAEPLNGLANLFRELGRYEQADVLYQRALSLRRLHLGPQHIDVAETLHDLAQLRQMQQQPIEALSLYQQALTIREQVLGVQHPKTAEIRERLHAVSNALSQTEETTPLNARQPKRDE